MPPPLPHLAVLARPTSKNFGCVMLTIAFATQKKIPLHNFYDNKNFSLKYSALTNVKCALLC